MPNSRQFFLLFRFLWFFEFYKYFHSTHSHQFQSIFYSLKFDFINSSQSNLSQVRGQKEAKLWIDEMPHIGWISFWSSTFARYKIHVTIVWNNENLVEIPLSLRHKNENTTSEINSPQNTRLRDWLTSYYTRTQNLNS